MMEHPRPAPRGALPEQERRQGASGKEGAAAVRLSGFTREAKAREDGDAAARRAMNAIAVTSSLMTALIHNPGPNSDHESLVLAARTMLRSADETTQGLMRALSLEAHPWARHRVMRMVSAAVADRWTASARQGGAPTADVTAFVPVWQELSQYALPELQFVPPAEEPAAALRIAMLDALQPVMHEISIFSMLREVSGASAHARDVILMAAQKALGRLVAGERMSDRSKSMLMQTLLRNAGSVYASAWRRRAEDTIEELQSMDRQQQKQLLESNPDGLSLAPIDAAFEESFGKLVEMVQYLAAPKATAPGPDAEELHMPNEYGDEAQPAAGT